jgi:hypothetical protein
LGKTSLPIYREVSLFEEWKTLERNENVVEKRINPGHFRWSGSEYWGSEDFMSIRNGGWMNMKILWVNAMMS